MTKSTSSSTYQPTIRNHWYSAGAWWLSPLSLSLLSTMLAYIAVITPPNIVAIMLQERDYTFLNPSLFIVISISEIFFIFGIIFVSFVCDKGRIKVKKSPVLLVSNSLYKKALFLLLVTIIGEFTIGFILIERIGIQRLLSAISNPQLGLELRQQVVTISRIHGINILALQNFFFPVLLFIFMIIFGLPKEVIKRKNFFLFTFACAAYITVNLITFTRWQILQLFLGLIIIYISRKNSNGGIKFSSLLKIAFLFMVSSLAIFLGINMLKTRISGLDAVVGYILGSYNVAASVISGLVKQPYDNSTYVTFGFFWNAPFLGPHFRQLGISLGINLPGPNSGATNVWDTWSTVLNAAGLNSTYQWDTVYGCVYGDIGILFPIVFFVYAVISQFLFLRAIDGKLYSILLYVYFAISIVTWFTSVFVSNTALDDYAISSFFLWLWFRRDWSRSLRNVGRS